MQYNSGPFISDSDNDAQVNMVSYSNFPSIIESMTFANKQTNSGLNLVYPHVNFTNKDVMERNLN